jgi:ribosomal protein L20
LKNSNIVLDRKILSELSVNEPAAMSAVISIAQKAIKKQP